MQPSPTSAVRCPGRAERPHRQPRPQAFPGPDETPPKTGKLAPGQVVGRGRAPADPRPRRSKGAIPGRTARPRWSNGRCEEVPRDRAGSRPSSIAWNSSWVGSLYLERGPSGRGGTAPKMRNRFSPGIENAAKTPARLGNPYSSPCGSAQSSSASVGSESGSRPRRRLSSHRLVLSTPGG